MGKRNEFECVVRNPFMAVADICGLSEKTIRTAFARKPITLHTACVIAKHMGIDLIHFRIKPDSRGRKRKQ